MTAADREVERFIAARLGEVFPDDGIHGEEGTAASGRSGRIWVVDPIDGTFNFVRGGDQWAVSIGLFEAGRPQLGVIHAPARSQTLVGGLNHDPTLNGEALAPLSDFVPERAAAAIGIHPSIPVDTRLAMMRAVMEDARMSFRCCGSATISLMEVVRGEVDGYLGLGESTWDVMAALPILERLGAATTVDWSQLELSSKLRFTVGKSAFVSLVAPFLIGAT